MGTIYCHFSFRRRNNNEYGLFSVAFYSDYDGKKCLGHITRKESLWVPEGSYITAIQSYEHALRTIFESQPIFKKHSVDRIYLVSDNSALVKWVCNHKTCRFKGYMEKAVEEYRLGAIHEITIPIGMCKPWKNEKSYKYCNERYIYEDKSAKIVASDGVNKLDLGDMQLQSLADIEKDNIARPVVMGITKQ